MLNQREILFLQIVAQLQWLNPTQLAQAQQALQTARAQGNPIALWDMLVHWGFLTKPQAERALQQVLQAENLAKTQTGAGQPAFVPPIPAATPAPNQPASAAPAVAPVADTGKQHPTGDLTKHTSRKKLHLIRSLRKSNSQVLVLVTVLTLSFIVGVLAYMFLGKKTPTPSVATNPTTTQTPMIEPTPPVTVAPGGKQTSGDEGPPEEGEGATEKPEGPGSSPPPPDQATLPPPPDEGPPPDDGPPVETTPPPPQPMPQVAPQERRPQWAGFDAEKIMADIDTQLPDLRRQANYAEGLTLLDDARAFVKDEDSVHRLDDMERDFKRYAFDALLAQVTELRNKNQFDKAFQLLEDARKYGPDFIEAINANIEKLKKEKEAVEFLSTSIATTPSPQGGNNLNLEEIQPIIAAYNSVMPKLSPLLEQRHVAQALSLVEIFVGDQANAPLKGFLEQLKADLPKLQNFLERSQKHLKEKAGQEVNLVGGPVKIISADNDKLTIELNGQRRDKPWLKLSGLDFMRSLGLTEDNATPDDLVAVGLIYFSDRRYNEAGPFFSKASANNPGVAVYQEIKRIAPEVEANKGIEEIRAALEKKDIRSVQKLLKDFKTNHEQTNIYKTHEGFLSDCKGEVENFLSARKKEMNEQLEKVSKVAKDLLEDLEKDYESKRKDILEKKGKDMEDKKSFLLKEDPTTKLCDVDTPDKTISKEDNLKEVQGMLKDKIKSLTSAGKKKLRDAENRLEKEVNQINAKYRPYQDRLDKMTKGRKAGIESRKRALSTRIQDGESPSPDEIRAFLNGDKEKDKEKDKEEKEDK